jgi:signal transduction histidine kinase
MNPDSAPMPPQAAAVNILLVDDLSENLFALEALIRGEGRLIHCAASGDTALSLMLEHEFALAIVDVQMPGMNGFELAQLMRGTDRTRGIPIVFVTAAGHEQNYAFHGYESGAVDFLYKPLDPHAVRGKVSVFIELARQRQALQQTQRALQHAVTMRDDFMSMVSHELRTPLNTLFLQMQLRQRLLAGDGPPDQPSLLRMVERDDRQIRSMIRLIDDMLDVSRMRTGSLAMQFASTDLAALVRGVVESFSGPGHETGATLTLEAPASVPLVCDEFRIEQVVINLITNARRYGAGQPVQIRVEATVDGAVVAIKDGGIGIAPADQARIFEQFERGQEVRKVAGLGLGLFISRQIVRAHGGEIGVASEPGCGSEFTVRLPRAPAPT